MLRCAIIEAAGQQCSLGNLRRAGGQVAAVWLAAARSVCSQQGLQARTPAEHVHAALAVCHWWVQSEERFTHQAKANAMRKNNGTQLGSRISTSTGPHIQEPRAGGAYPIRDALQAEHQRKLKRKAVLGGPFSTQDALQRAFSHYRSSRDTTQAVS